MGAGIYVASHAAPFLFDKALSFVGFREPKWRRKLYESEYNSMVVSADTNNSTSRQNLQCINYINFHHAPSHRRLWDATQLANAYHARRPGVPRDAIIAIITRCRVSNDIYWFPHHSAVVTRYLHDATSFGGEEHKPLRNIILPPSVLITP